MWNGNNLVTHYHCSFFLVGGIGFPGVCGKYVQNLRKQKSLSVEMYRVFFFFLKKHSSIFCWKYCYKQSALFAMVIKNPSCSRNSLQMWEERGLREYTVLTADDNW